MLYNKVKELIELFDSQDILYSMTEENSTTKVEFRGMNNFRYELCFSEEGSFLEFNLETEAVNRCIKGRNIAYMLQDNMMDIVIFSNCHLSPWKLGLLERKHHNDSQEEDF